MQELITELVRLELVCFDVVRQVDIGERALDHISAGTGLIRAKSATVGLGSPQPHQLTALVQALRN